MEIKKAAPFETALINCYEYLSRSAGIGWGVWVIDRCEELWAAVKENPQTNKYYWIIVLLHYCINKNLSNLLQNNKLPV
jgi:hypothetical protein